MANHWYLVAHRGGARLFVQEGINNELHVARRFENPQGKLKESELVSDRQGRSDHTGFPGHSAVGSEDATRSHALQVFAQQLGVFLEEEAKKDSFESLVLVAEAHFLGELNKFIGHATTSRQRAPLIKDLVHVSDHEMLQHLSSVVRLQEDINPHA